MKNAEQFMENMIALRSRVNRYADIHCQYDNYNAWRTCEVLSERISAAIAVIYLYCIGVLQNANYYQVINGIEFDCAEERNEFEKITFENDKNFRDMKKETLGYLRALQNITDYSCDNISTVQEVCIEFVDLIDEVIKFNNLE